MRVPYAFYGTSSNDNRRSYLLPHQGQPMKPGLWYELAVCDVLSYSTRSYLKIYLAVNEGEDPTRNDSGREINVMT